MILLIDNFDSFTFNLAQILLGDGEDLRVLRNDRPEILDLAKRPDLSGVIVSPGPGRPENAGLCLRFLDLLPAAVPVLGVCLGHQALGLWAGAEVRRAEHIMHGKDSAVAHEGTGIFAGIPNPTRVARYHSLLVCPGPDTPFRITARTDRDEVMALEFSD
ncbi:MAG: aminodeoxychorismate/anthranilate synthase component II, partial [Deltaproteobacteria bacterium]|nr:aminodeoxychorismate/anthranilate synthase component II [Deltaproteobacteria bacterium]